MQLLLCQALFFKQFLHKDFIYTATSIYEMVSLRASSSWPKAISTETFSLSHVYLNLIYG